MPPTLTYPGVYIVEVPSGVQTITGVATSIGAFFGQASQGPLNTPIECQTPSDYTRNFGAPIAGGYLGQMVQQFFANGGSDCYVVRIAGPGAAPSTVTLNDVAGNPVLTLNAASQGAWSNNLLVAIDYDTPTPDATFNLKVIYMNQGAVAQTESLTSLSMDKSSPRYAPTFIAQSSQLLSIPAGQPAPVTAINQGYSQARYPFAGLANTDAIGPALAALYNAAWGGTGNINISVDGGPVTQVSLTAVGVNTSFANLQTYVQNQINNALGASSNTSVALSEDASPGATPVYFLRLTSTGTLKSSVAVTRAASNDLASILMAGVDQGGIEVPRFSDLRPAPNGITFTGDTATVMTELAAANVDQVSQITVGGNVIPIALGVSGTPFYKGASATDFGGIQENLQTIANLINSGAPGWEASLAGYRLIVNEVRPNSPLDTDSTFALAAAAGSNAVPLGNGFKSLQAQTQLASGNDGGAITPAAYQGVELQRTGFWALDSVPLFNLMVLPGDGLNNETDWQAVRSAAAVYCASRRAFLLLDAPMGWTKNNLLHAQASDVQNFRAAIGAPTDSCAVFYPRVQVNDNGTLRYMGVSGIMAGVCAATDSARGVWSAPAGTNALLTGVTGLEVTLTDKQNGILNPLAVDCLRSFSVGYVNWGARTVAGFDDTPDDDYKYMNVRRFALFLEESLYDGTQWVVFQNNADPLWAQIRMNVTAFMMNLFRQGAFAGTTPQTAFFVKCDAETTTPSDQNLGIVNIIVGFAPLKPAEFVVISIQQISNLS
ncbi:MAG: phage tail sheath C-terminal domain-containing protein [Bryobacteraceae bacterium]|jgi:phage tail sheath protein FI